MKAVFHLFGIVAVALVLALPARAGDSDHLRTITVQGIGNAAAKPDIAQINIGVVSEAEQAAGALNANNGKMADLFAILDKFDIAERDRQTSGFNVSPRYDRPGREGGLAEIAGYQVTNQVSVRVRKLGDLGPLLDAIVKGGANRVHGIGFSVDDPTAVLDEARKAAVADAKRRAELYAGSLDLELGDVLQISEVQVRAPRVEFAAPRLAVAQAVPVAPGEQEFGASVTVVFEIDD